MKSAIKFFAIFISALALGGCRDAGNCITGIGSSVEKNYSVSNFTEVSFAGYAAVSISKGSTYSLRIVGQQNVLDILDVRVSAGKLYIGEKTCVRKAEKLQIYITLPALNGVHCSGSIDVTTNHQFNAAQFVVEVSGTGVLNLNVDAQYFSSNISGDATLIATGTAPTQNYITSGVGSYQCFGLIGDDVSVDVSGTANHELYASKTLGIEVSGSATVYYKGHPAVTQDVSSTLQLVDAN